MVDRARKPPAISANTPPLPQPVVDISADNSKVLAKLPSGESVEVLLYGATVTSWKNANGSENLWLSEGAILDGSKPVRGGIPLVFPVFGPPPADHATSSLPQHGFARNSRWEYLGKSTSESSAPPHPQRTNPADGSVKLDFGLFNSKLSQAAKDAWPYQFGLIYSVTLSQDGLQTSINVRNEGDGPFEFKMLLHTYLRVEDISETKITGLLSVSYVDKVLNATTQNQSEPDIKIHSEVDRVYSKIPQSTTSVLSSEKPRFDVVRDNLPDTVVWNPWKEKAASMSDFKPVDGYTKMVCVEAGAVADWIKLEAGECYEGGQLIKSYV